MHPAALVEYRAVLPYFESPYGTGDPARAAEIRQRVDRLLRLTAIAGRS
ncbi:hypothetical protein [Streptomyces melanogenes]